MNGYLSKPIDPLLLAQELEKWLPKETHETHLMAGEPVSPKSRITSHKSVVWDRSGMLKRMMGDRDLGETMVKMFLSDIPGRIQALKDLLAREDAPGVRMQAHSIKGASANMGAEALRAAALEMEKAAANGDLGIVRKGLEELETQFERVQKEMENGLLKCDKCHTTKGNDASASPQ